MRGVTFARKLRKASTDAEHRLWHRLRGGRVEGHKFRRQHAIGPYFADFACPARRLIVELDGGQHADQEGYDDERTYYLRSAGWCVVRFWDNDVLMDTEAVLERILALLSDAPHPNPLPARRGEGDGRAKRESGLA